MKMYEILEKPIHAIRWVLSTSTGDRRGDMPKILKALQSEGFMKHLEQRFEEDYGIKSYRSKNIVSGDDMKIGDRVDVQMPGALPHRGVVQGIRADGKAVMVRFCGGTLAEYPPERMVRVG